MSKNKREIYGKNTLKQVKKSYDRIKEMDKETDKEFDKYCWLHGFYGNKE